MEVTQNAQTRGVSIETLYNWYKSEKFLVNRRYQRKLVWTIEEKAALIESISKYYPLPLILVAEVSHNSVTVFEIIDGMQRLEAIFAFIEGKVMYDNKYFDLETLGLTKSLKDSGILKQNLPMWDKEFCLSFTTYIVPLLSYKQDNEQTTDEIFKRINYYGKHLSDQELRQAGSETIFAHLVRRISESVRGDVSHADKLTLNNMSKISISNASLLYGIQYDKIFWKKNNIITVENIRKSRDEELVAHLVAGIILEPRLDATAKQLDYFYVGNRLIEDGINKMGEEYIVKCFDIVFTEIRNTFENDSFYCTLFKKETKRVNRAFQVIFFAFYDLLIKQEKVITNYKKLRKALIGVGDKLITPSIENLNKEECRSKIVNAIIGNMEPFFREREVGDPALDNGIMKLESLLTRSHTENTNYDFKIGFHRLEEKGKFDQNAFDKVLQTLVAMANISKNSIGYVVLGIADKKSDKDRHEELYGVKARQFQGHWIVGLQNEAYTYQSQDKYLMSIKDKIKSSSITPKSYIDDILSSIDCFNYYDKTIIILRIQNKGNDVAKYNGKIFQRQGTSTEEVLPKDEASIWRRILM